MKQNKSTLLLFTVFLVVCGLLLIYRGLISADSYQQFNATVKGKVISKNKKYNNGENYSLDLTFLEKDKVYGIYLGTKDQANSDDLINKIKVGTNYKFYVDPSVVTTFGGVNLGIRLIELNGLIIYKENQITNILGGSILIMFGLVSALFFIYLKRKKTSYKRK